MDKKIIEKVRKFVESECKKPTSKYGHDPYPFHFVPVVRYADELAKELGGDREVISIAAWLHDIGSIIHGRKDHHLSGAKIAEEKLRELNYPEEKIALVKKCILNHRGSHNNGQETIEEKILVEADTMSAFDNMSGIFKAAYVYEDYVTQKEAGDAVRKKLENKWKQLHFKKSKEVIRPKYEAAMLLLK